MRRVFLILILFCTVGYAWGQSNPQPLIFLVSIDNKISQDVIDGKFFIKAQNGKQVDEMPFNAWVGKLEMENRDYKKLFKIDPQDSLYVTFANNNFALHTDYVYEVKIPTGMMNNKYLILNIYNQKDEENREKYAFPKDQEYIIQVESPVLSRECAAQAKSAGALVRRWQVAIIKVYCFARL